MKKTVAALAALLLFATACSDDALGSAMGEEVGGSVANTSPAAQPEEAPEPEPVEEPEPEPVIEEEPEPEPEPEPTPKPEHDWPSVSAYQADLMDSAENVAELLDLAGEVAGMYGRVSDDEIIGAFVMASVVIRSHIDHFEGTTPPPEYAEAQRLLLEAWVMFEESWILAAEGVRTDSVSELDAGLRLMESGTAKVNEATRALP